MKPLGLSDKTQTFYLFFTLFHRSFLEFGLDLSDKRRRHPLLEFIGRGVQVQDLDDLDHLQLVTHVTHCLHILVRLASLEQNSALVLW